MITRRGWAQEILAKQDPAGWWVSGESLYQPKYLSTNWMLLILADLGLSLGMDLDNLPTPQAAAYTSEDSDDGEHETAGAESAKQ